MRHTQSINQEWLFSKTAITIHQAIQEASEMINLPHTWNAIDGQDGGNDYHRGTCWYIKKLDKPAMNTGDRVYLEFLGVAMTADVYVNNQLLCHHEGGYSTFRIDVTKAMDETNIIAVAVSNEDNQTVYPQKADFTFYGGIYRDVNLITVPKEHFVMDDFGAPGIKVTPKVNLNDNSADILVEAWVQGNPDRVVFNVDNQELSVNVLEGYAKGIVQLKKVHLWQGLQDPFMYELTAKLESGDEVSIRFGCRHFEMDPNQGFILNGNPYPLRGVSRHQDFKDLGNALNMEVQKKDMAIIKEIGATTLRLAHYQHSQEFYNLCDEVGLVVWAEIPYITMHMKQGQANTLSQMKELIVQNHHHPSIVVWGLSNEITAASTVDEELLENHKKLNDLCHEMDSSRPTTLANVFMLETDSPLLNVPDINSYNLYFGWYLGELEQNDDFFDEYHAKYPERVIGFSEYGADANPQYQSSNPEKGDYSESYQAIYHEHMLKMIEARPWLWATHVWNLFDFAADGRDEGGKHGENQKGLVTFDRSLKKDAFYLYKAAWNKDQGFVHLCGSRYRNRAEEVTEVKVYSNQNSVALWVDGKLIAEQPGRTIFKFKVALSGEHHIEARSGDYRDEITLVKVEEADMSYIFNGRQQVTNWFDQEVDPSCYSLSDTLGEIRANPQAGAIIEAMMTKNAESRGDVADVVKDNPALVRMMNRITMISLLKQSGADEESIKQINRILQNIPKTPYNPE